MTRLSSLYGLLGTFAVVLAVTDKATAGRFRREIVSGKCGTSAVEPKRGNANRIIRGSEVVPHSYPFMISMHKDFVGWYHCGASLIRTKNDQQSNMVVTAAHCFDTPSKARFAVAGVHDQYLVNHGPQQSKVKKIIVHESYNQTTIENDIAVIVLETPVKFDDNAQPICLPSADQEVAVNTEMIIIGWGERTEGSGVSSDKLMQASVHNIDMDNCTGDLVPLGYKIDKKSMICAADDEGHDSCKGDSGGPLFTGNGGSDPYVLYGIISFGVGCGRANRPGVNTKVSNYVKWIQDHVAIHGI